MTRPRRHRGLGLALLLSALLHGALFVWLAHHTLPPRPPPAPPAAALEVEVVEAAPVPRPASAPPARTSRQRRPPPAEAPAPPAPQAAPLAAAPPAPAPGADRPERGEDARAVGGRLTLLPDDALSRALKPGRATPGRTLRPGDAALAPEPPAEQGARLQARVQGWADDDAAGVRAQRGVVDPYWRELRRALEGELAHADGGTPAQLGVDSPLAGLVKNYTRAAEQYARTGNPGLPPPGAAPRQSEQLTQRFGDVNAAPQDRTGSGRGPGTLDAALGTLHALAPRTMAQARETLDGLKALAPLFSVKLELRQARDGRLLSATVLEGSGSAPFDAFVVAHVPDALGRLPLPGERARRGRDTLRTHWQVEGWLEAPTELEEAVLVSLATGSLALPVDRLLARARGDGGVDAARFEFRARLLREY